MDKEKISDGVIRYFQGSAREFTPITVSADFAALARPSCLGSLERSDGVKKTGVGMASNPLNHNDEGGTTWTGL